MQIRMGLQHPTAGVTASTCDNPVSRTVATRSLSFCFSLVIIALLVSMSSSSSSPCNVNVWLYCLVVRAGTGYSRRGRHRRAADPTLTADPTRPADTAWLATLILC